MVLRSPHFLVVQNVFGITLNNLLLNELYTIYIVGEILSLIIYMSTLFLLKEFKNKEIKINYVVSNWIQAYYIKVDHIV